VHLTIEACIIIWQLINASDMHCRWMISKDHRKRASGTGPSQTPEVSNLCSMLDTLGWSHDDNRGRVLAAVIGLRSVLIYRLQHHITPDVRVQVCRLYDYVKRRAIFGRLSALRNRSGVLSTNFIL
jgi:hypothetical protein